MGRGVARLGALALVVALTALGEGCTYVVARVARLEPAGLRMCNVAVGVLASEMREACGEPDAIVSAVVGPAERCWLYRSTADYRAEQRTWLVNPRYSVASAPWVAACVVSEKVVRREAYRERVVIVEFLSEGPVLTSTAGPASR